jgi:hypothetical protein
MRTPSIVALSIGQFFKAVDFWINSLLACFFSRPKPLLKFHSVHGTNVTLLNDGLFLGITRKSRCWQLVAGMAWWRNVFLCKMIVLREDCATEGLILQRTSV